MILTGVLGTNGSGKTTLIRRLMTELAAKGKRSAVIVNEHGLEEYGDEFIKAQGFIVEDLRGGCVGCTLAGSVLGLIKKFKKEIDPDFVFIEPSEMVVAYRLKNVFLMGLRDVKYEVGPLISLVDGPDFDLNWSERNQIILNHIKETDLAVISRADLLEDGKEAEIREILKLFHRSIPAISVHRDQGLEELVSLYG